jgi:hypothetical protein
MMAYAIIVLKSIPSMTYFRKVQQRELMKDTLSTRVLT